jgi:hypothetical protein
MKSKYKTNLAKAILISKKGVAKLVGEQKGEIMTPDRWVDLGLPFHNFREFLIFGDKFY